MARRCSLILCVVSLIALTTPGAASAWTFDPAFGSGGVSTVTAHKPFYGTSTAVSVARPGGGWIVAGSSLNDGYFEDYWTVAAFTADGRRDVGFGNAGRTMLKREFGSEWLRYSPASALAIQPDGKILVGSTVDIADSSDYDDYDRVMGDPECNCTASRAGFAVIRLTRNGKIDRSFGRKGLALIRSVVLTWDEALEAQLFDIAVDSRGRALIYGNSTNLRKDEFEQPYGLVYRLRRSGAIDRSFGVRGRVVERWPEGSAFFGGHGSLAVGPDDSFTTVSTAQVAFAKKNETTVWAVRRHLANGASDTSFGTSGIRKVILSDGSPDLIDSSTSENGTVTMAGATLANDGAGDWTQRSQTILARVLPSGGMDVTFGSSGVSRMPIANGFEHSPVTALFVAPDGSIQLTEELMLTGASGSYGNAVHPTALVTVDSSGTATAPAVLPELKHPYDLHVSAIYPSATRTVLVGDRFAISGDAGPRMTLVGALP